MTTRTPQPLRLPPAPATPERPPFPLVASTAPVVVALLLWAITRSPIALMFAAIGPIVAVGGLVDGVRSRRTVRRRQRAAHRTAVAVVRDRLAAARAEERRTAWLAHPSAMDRFLGGADDPARWGRDAPGPVTAGSGTTMSAVELIDGAGQRETGPEVDAEREALLEESASIDDMPVVVDAGGGIGVVGDDSLVRTVMRGLVLQLCDDVPPRRLRLVAVPERHWDWAAALPHAAQSDADAPGLLVVHRGADPAQPQPAPPASDHHGRTGVVIAGAATVRALPPGCATIIRVRSAVEAEVVRGQVAHYGPFVPELVGEEHAAAHAAMLASLAVRERSPTVPSLVRLADLARVTAGPLGCAIGRGSHGDVVVDLVADGPHAVVGGTTGSGKSELLITWIAAMASRTTPKEFAFLLVDFKGGATGAVLAELPHCLGVVTDLDGPLSDRVLQSLDAEIRRRERLVAAAGVRSIDELPPGRLPRLVVVIDELAALLASAPDLHALLADVAARGRSLGMHLILCTQRPAGVIREALLANCGLRIALRVHDLADSVAMVGIPDAARLPTGAPGRCLISRGREIAECQLAATVPADLRRIAHSAAPVDPADRPSRPWIAPLPAVLPVDGHVVREALAREAAAGSPAGGALVGVVDEPRHQRQLPARWPEDEHGLLVLGGPRSGRTSVLRRLAGESTDARFVVADVEGTWDALERAEAVGGGTVLLDDWDAVAGLWSVDHRHAAVERLARILHAARCRVVVSAQGIGSLGAAVGLLDSRIVLRLDDRADHLAAGAPAALWSGHAPPGRGVWHGSAIQVIAPGGDEAPAAARSEPPALSATTGPIIVVSTRARHVAGVLRGALPGRAIAELMPSARPDVEIVGRSAPVLVADPDTWLANGGALTALRARSSIAFESCSVGDFRMLARTRELPPALRPGSGRLWVLAPDGTVTRGRLGP